MKPFNQFFLEYRHKLADGTDAPSMHPHNGKNPNSVGPDKKNLHTIGPYEKDNDKLNLKGSFVSLIELEQMGLKDLMELQKPTVFQNVKNSGAAVQVYRDKQGRVVGRVIKASIPDK